MTKHLPSIILFLVTFLFSVSTIDAQGQMPSINGLESNSSVIGYDKASSSTVELSMAINGDHVGTVIPLEIASFTGDSKGCLNMLNWSTELELTTSHYEILASTDGLQYSVLDEVKAVGNSLQQSHYNFSHQVSNAKTYYRIRAFDTNGSSRMSDVVEINAACKVLLDELSLFPNPTNQDINLTFSTQKERSIQLFVIDRFGRVALEKQVEVTTGDNTINLSTNELMPGSYHIKIQGDYFYRLKFIKIQ